MRKAIWFFANGSTVTKGATGDIGVLIAAGHKIARRSATRLVGWRFES